MISKFYWGLKTWPWLSDQTWNQWNQFYVSTSRMFNIYSTVRLLNIQHESIIYPQLKPAIFLLRFASVHWGASEALALSIKWLVHQWQVSQYFTSGCSPVAKQYISNLGNILCVPKYIMHVLVWNAYMSRWRYNDF